MTIKKKNVCDCNNGKDCHCKIRKNNKSKGLKISVVLLLGAVIGAVVGVKYHKELTKTALDSWSSAQKSSKKYAHLSEKQLKGLKKDMKKKLKNR